VPAAGGAFAFVDQQPEPRQNTVRERDGRAKQHGAGSQVAWGTERAPHRGARHIDGRSHRPQGARSPSAGARSSGSVRMNRGGRDGLRRPAPSVAAMQAADPGEGDDVGCRVGTLLDQTPARRVLADAEVRPVLIVVAVPQAAVEDHPHDKRHRAAQRRVPSPCEDPGIAADRGCRHRAALQPRREWPDLAPQAGRIREDRDVAKRYGTERCMTSATSKLSAPPCYSSGSSRDQVGEVPYRESS
jgi:hypothetical protein